MKLALAGVLVFAALMLPFKIMGSPLTPEQKEREERARKEAEEIIKNLPHAHLDIKEILKELEKKATEAAVKK
jgi:hypothetical protein